MTFVKSSIACLLCLGALAAFAQNTKKAEKYYQKAYYKYGFQEYEDVEKLLYKSLRKDSNYLKSYFLLSDVYNQTQEPEKEEWAYQKVLSIDSLNIRALINLAELYLYYGKFADAHSYSQLLLSRKPHLPEQFHDRIDRIVSQSAFCWEMVNNPVDVEMEWLRGQVNTKSDEYWPYLSPDGNTLYFTRAEWLDKMLEAKGYLEENIYVSRKVMGNWQEAQKIPGAINTIENEGAQVLTQDGKTLYFTACNRKRYEGDCNIYVSHWRNGKWSPPKKLPPPVNTPHKESQPSISYNGKYLFFSSNRPGGFGGQDIWVTRMNEDSLWANPINLGPRVNTALTEESPHIHVDNNTLYFSSNGHQGMGRGDLFVVKLADTSDAQNLGYPINDHQQQLGIMVETSGKWAYYASMRESDTPHLDLKRFTLPPAYASDEVCIIEGFIYGNDASSLQAVIEVHNVDNGQTIMTYETNQDGYFSFRLPQQSTYSLVVNKPGYMLYTQEVPCRKENSLNDITLEPISQNAKVVVQSIHFDFNSSKLKPSSVTTIQKILQFLERNPNVHIEIGGHTDSIGSKQYNLELSRARARAVRDTLYHLASAKTSIKERVRFVGYGNQQPIASNATESGRALNRRTEIRVVAYKEQE